MGTVISLCMLSWRLLIQLDIDECADSAIAIQCDSDAVCVNTPGSYNCVCNSGYTGSGTTCTGIEYY